MNISLTGCGLLFHTTALQEHCPLNNAPHPLYDLSSTQRLRKIEPIFNTINENWGQFHHHVYKQLLHMQIPKSQKDKQAIIVVLLF